MMQTNHDLQWLHAVRDRELESALEHFPANPEARVLELGSGTGYMLRRIRERYPNVSGLEVRGSAYCFEDPDIHIYDGRQIPFDDGTFDVVFSSHVLEHIGDIDEALVEMARVLKSGGVAVHIIPSPTWRVLTSLFHYFAVVKLALATVSPRGRGPVTAQAEKKTRGELLKFLLYAPGHGERGTVVTEAFYFSRLWWKRVFADSPFDLERAAGVGFVYWGRDLLRLRLPFAGRSGLARLFGSASNLYVLSKGE
jgi:SAM-dependent methyltransferase